MNFQPPPNLEEKLRQIFSHGLSNGLGERGKQVCIEAAICEALGEPHDDKPSCVHEIDRTLIIGLNDCPWSSPEARAEGMWPLALPQLGTTGRDRTVFLGKVIEGTIRRIVPMALRAAAKVHATNRDVLENAAVRCEKEGSQESAEDAYYAARYADAEEAYTNAVCYAKDAAHYAEAAAGALKNAYYYIAANTTAHTAAYAADAATTADAVLKEMVSVIVDAYEATKEAV